MITAEPNSGPAGSPNGIPKNGTQSDQLAQLVDTELPLRLPFFVVGLGVSGGGQEATCEFFDAMPSDSGMAFILVQYLPPDRESTMADILSRHKQVKSWKLEDGVAVEANCIYVIRPGSTLTTKNGALHLGEPVEKCGHRKFIDDFFRSLVEEQRQRHRDHFIVNRKQWNFWRPRNQGRGRSLHRPISRFGQILQHAIELD